MGFRNWNFQLDTSAFVDPVTNESADHWPTYLRAYLTVLPRMNTRLTTSTSQPDFNFEHNADETASAEIDNDAAWNRISIIDCKTAF